MLSLQRQTPLITAAYSPHKQDVGNQMQTPHSDRPTPVHTQSGDGRSMIQSNGMFNARSSMPADASMEQPIDPALTRRDNTQDPGYVEALKAWARFRFVRAGWFTAQEAIEYIE
jgi:hypothetical protein